MNNKLAHFKANYGASYEMMTELLQENFQDVREWSKHDTTPKEVDKQIDRIDNFLRTLVSQGRLLRDQFPLIQVLEHDKEMLNKTIEELRTITALYEHMSFWNRVKFVLWGRL